MRLWCTHGLFNATMSIMSYDYDKIEEAGLEDPYNCGKKAAGMTRPCYTALFHPGY